MMTESLTKKSSKEIIIGILIVMLFIVVIVPLMTSPTNKLFGESVYSIRSAFHGLSALIFMITSVIGVYQTLHLWRGSEINISELEIGSVVNASACFLSIFFGNWVYIPYRAQGGPRSHFLAAAPEIHKIFFEFNVKERKNEFS